MVFGKLFRKRRDKKPGCPRCGSERYGVAERQPDQLFADKGRTRVRRACPDCGFSKETFED